jgi:hypothetical protein
MSFDVQVANVCRSCYGHIKRLARKRPYLTSMEGTELGPAGVLVSDVISQTPARLLNRCARELRDHGELDIMRASTKLGQRSFGSSASRLWNTLPETVTTSTSLPVFMSRLKTLMYRQSFNV